MGWAESARPAVPHLADQSSLFTTTWSRRTETTRATNGAGECCATLACDMDALGPNRTDFNGLEYEHDHARGQLGIDPRGI